jgi:hypothetical protein
MAAVKHDPAGIHEIPQLFASRGRVRDERPQRFRRIAVGNELTQPLVRLFRYNDWSGPR